MDALRYSATSQLTGYFYSPTFVYLSTTLTDAAALLGIGEDTILENGCIKKIQRGVKYNKETFNYKQPANLLKNYNFLELGDFIRQYTTGVGVNLTTTKEYKMKWWTAIEYAPNPPVELFIRVVFDYLGNEINRYCVINNTNSFDATKAVISTGIEISKDDVVSLSFTVRTNQSQAGFQSRTFNLLLTDGVQSKTLSNLYPDPSSMDI